MPRKRGCTDKGNLCDIRAFCGWSWMMRTHRVFKLGAAFRMCYTRPMNGRGFEMRRPGWQGRRVGTFDPQLMNIGIVTILFLGLTALGFIYAAQPEIASEARARAFCGSSPAAKAGILHNTIVITIRAWDGKPQYSFNTIPQTPDELEARLKRYSAEHGQPDPNYGVFIRFGSDVTAVALFDLMRRLKAAGLKQWKVEFGKLVLSNDSNGVIIDCLTVSSDNLRPEFYPPKIVDCK